MVPLLQVRPIQATRGTVSARLAGARMYSAQFVFGRILGDIVSLACGSLASSGFTAVFCGYRDRQLAKEGLSGRFGGDVRDCPRDCLGQFVALVASSANVLLYRSFSLFSRLRSLEHHFS